MRDALVNLIVALGPNLDPAEYGPQPEHIHLERYIPQSLILPRCDLVIAHGGFSTVLTTLAAGLPLVLIQIAADMFDNARRCAALDLGRVVEPDQRTAEGIREAVQRMLTTPTYQENAQRLRTEIEAQPDPTHAVTLLEQLAADKRPLPRGHQQRCSNE